MLIKQFNQYAESIKPLLRKALTSATGVGEALVPQKLEQIVTNTIIRLSPEFALIEAEYDAQKLHEFNRVTGLGAAGGAMGEGAVTPTRNSTYERNATVTLKNIRRKGAVTNFLQDASQKYIDSAATEMENVIRAHVYDLNFYNLFGNAVANPYEYSGWDKAISSNRFDFAGAVPSNLRHLDKMIDASNRKGGMRHKRAFIMTPEQLSLSSALLANVRLNQGLVGNMSQVDINGGWRLNAYRDIPILESTYMGGIGADTMGSVTPTAGGTGTGTLSDGTYHFIVTKYTVNGESIPTSDISITLSGGGSTQKILLSFTADPNAYKYRIYYSTSSSGHTLIDERCGFTYDADGTITGVIDSMTVLSVAASANITTAMQADKPPTVVSSVNPEPIYLIDFDKFQGMGKFAYTHSQGNRVDGLVSIKPLAETDDFLPFLVKTYGAIVDAFEATSCVYRNVRAA